MFRHKQKQIFYNFKWLGYLALTAGVILVTIGMLIQLIPIGEAQFHMTINGVEQPYTIENVTKMRLLFLGIMGGLGGLFLITALIIIGRSRHRAKLIGMLKQSGEKVMAEVIDYAPSQVRINNQPARYLVCTYQNMTGENLIFKSGLLRRNPISFLSDKKVIVYYDSRNPNRYFVDVDESMGKVVNL
ncbi:hypothetical protein ACBP45_00930 [Latilactobacillus sakei]